MDSINSVAKGVFVFKNGVNIKKLKAQRGNSQIQNKFCENYFGSENGWYNSFQETWKELESRINKLQSKSYKKTLKNLLNYINDAVPVDGMLHTAALLTGINQSDHLTQFESLSKQIQNNCFSIPIILQSRDCQTLKTTIESLVWAVINYRDDELDYDDKQHKIKRHQLTIQYLVRWYNKTFEKERPKIVVMLADFEQFSSNVLQDAISILTSYSNKLSIVLVTGIATAFNALHNTLPYHITSQLSVQIFQSESSSTMLSMILDKVILNHHSPFHLSGKSFKTLMEIFLFYDYSIKNFLSGFKTCMMEHFYYNDLSQFCISDQNKLSNMIEKMSNSECERIRENCPSFRKFVESETNAQVQIDLLTNDDIFKKKLLGRFVRVHRHWYQFYCILRVLVVMLDDLPRNDLGRQLRELYPICMSNDITQMEQFQECVKLWKFSSKDNILKSLTKIEEIMIEYLNDNSVSEIEKSNMRLVLNNLKKYSEKIRKSGLLTQIVSNVAAVTPKEDTIMKNISRQDMMKQLKDSAASSQARKLTEFEQCLYETVNYLVGVFQRYLVPIQLHYSMYEISLFDDHKSARRQILGAPRGSIHTALCNPHHYLNCNCCKLSNSQQMLSTLPDICIAYKLHLECNKHVNLFDWLQAFNTVLNVNQDEDDDEIPQEIQARFTRAISELQFLGLIKQTRSKTDHVTRLTW